MDSNKILDRSLKNQMKNEGELTETVQIIAAASFEEREKGNLFRRKSRDKKVNRLRRGGRYLFDVKKKGGKRFPSKPSHRLIFFFLETCAAGRRVIISNLGTLKNN